MAEGNDDGNAGRRLNADVESLISDLMSHRDLGSLRRTERSARDRRYTSAITKIKVPSGRILWTNFFGRYNLSTIEEIDASDSQFGLPQLYHVARFCPSLAYLNLKNCFERFVYNRGNPDYQRHQGVWRLLARNCPNITSLGLRNYRVFEHVLNRRPSGLRLRDVASGEFVQDLRLFRNLMILDLGDNSTWLTDNHVHTLCAGGLPKLSDLTLRENRHNITDNAIRSVAANCPNLVSLDLKYCRGITHQSLLALAQCSLLTSLNIAETLVDCGGNIFNALAQGCPRLMYLDLAECGVTDATLVALGRHCHDLVDLDMPHSTDISDQGVTALARGCPMLEKLTINSEDLKGDGIIELAEKCQNLRELDLSYCRSLEDTALQALAGCQKLESLYLNTCVEIDYITDEASSEITDAGVIALSRGCPSLRYLDLTDSLITERSIIAFARNHSGIQTLDVTMFEVETSTIRREWQTYHADAQTFFAQVRATIAREGDGESKRSMPPRPGNPKRRRIQLVESLVNLRF